MGKLIRRYKTVPWLSLPMEQIKPSKQSFEYVAYYSRVGELHIKV